MKNKKSLQTSLLVSAFCVLYFLVAQQSLENKSATYDEPINLTAGYSALVLSDYRIDAIHPPLGRMWAAIPLSFLDGIVFRQERESWKKKDSWTFSQDFIYEDNGAEELLAWGRTMAILLGLILGLLLFFWTYELYGQRVGIIILVIYFLEPNIMAHTRLVTTDIPVTLGIFASAFALYRTYKRLSFVNVLFLLLASGWAILSKFSAMILFPYFICAGLVRVFDRSFWSGVRGDSTTQNNLQRILYVSGIAFFLVLGWAFLIWWAYGFHYTVTPDATERLLFSTLEKSYDRAPLVSALIDLLDTYRILPNAYLQGFLGSLLHSGDRISYFLGERQLGGSWSYFPLAFLSKAPIGLLVLFLLACFWWPRRRYSDLKELRLVLILIGLYIMALEWSGANLGVRYALPLYPLFLLCSAGFVKIFLEEMKREWFVLFFPLIMLLESFLSYPHYLPFFNQMFGGPRFGHHLFLDSNLDWGQDLKGLNQWLKNNKIKHIYLSYFGTADPNSYGISFTPLVGSPFYLKNAVQEFKGPGYIAISATNLFGRHKNKYSMLLTQKPVHIVGHSIYVYWIERKHL